MAILLKGWIWPIGGASSGEGLRLQPAQPAQHACFTTLANKNFNLPISTDDSEPHFMSSNLPFQIFSFWSSNGVNP